MYNFAQKAALTALRLSLGWYFFYAGITKVLDPTWSAAGFLQNAATFPALYAWFASPALLPFVNVLNAWGLTLIGVALILGLGVRLASIAGIALMILYYVPRLVFPYVPPNAYLIDSHIIYAIGFFVLAAFHAGRVWGLEGWLRTNGVLRGSLAKLLS